jgi:hypothetical protein
MFCAASGLFDCLERECTITAASTLLTPSLDSILNNYNDDYDNDTVSTTSSTANNSTVSNNSDRTFMSSAMSSKHVHTTIDTHGNRVITQG